MVKFKEKINAFLRCCHLILLFKELCCMKPIMPMCDRYKDTGESSKGVQVHLLVVPFQKAFLKAYPSLSCHH